MSKASILREKLKEATAVEILRAAEAELAEQGLAATNMASIAKRAGVSVGTLYNYFRDKEVLLSTLLSDRKERFVTLLDDAIAKHAELPFTAQLEGVVDAVFDIFEAHRDFLRIMLSNEKPVLKSVADTRASDSRRPGAGMLTDLLRPVTDRGVAGGLLAPADADLYPCALAAFVRAVMIERLADTTRPFRTATPFVLRVFLDGARARP
jgi:AcrR family transcriptional regulator